jgi:hypothetical protein
LKQKSVLVIIAFLLVFSITCAGCLQENRTGLVSTTTSPSEVSDNSSMNNPPKPITSEYSEPFFVRTNQDTYPIGEVVLFWLENNGNTTANFTLMNPWVLEKLEGDYWNKYGSCLGYLEAKWELRPGERSGTFRWDTSPYYRDCVVVTPQNPEGYAKEPVEPGIYRIRFYDKSSRTQPGFTKTFTLVPASGYIFPVDYFGNFSARTDKDVYIIGETVHCWIENNGDSTASFVNEDPWVIEKLEGDKWVRFGTNGWMESFWDLGPGDRSKTYVWDTSPGNQNDTVSIPTNQSGFELPIEPGTYRIRFFDESTKIPNPNFTKSFTLIPGTP